MTTLTGFVLNLRTKSLATAYLSAVSEETAQLLMTNSCRKEKKCVPLPTETNTARMKYLDPKADLTFKKIFGEHPDLVTSLLNALLPFSGDEQILEIEYLPAELTPDQPLRKNSIVDVRCKDAAGRQFIVEMQMEWSNAFKQRVLFNASKAYVRQLGKSKKYHLLQPVYSLSLVNDIFEPDMAEYYHYYRMVHEEHTEKVIDGLNLVFVELPKFKPQTVSEKKMQVLWLRFLTEIDENTREAPEELLENPEVKRAIEVVEESAYSDAELQAYDKFWDSVRVEQTLQHDSFQDGLEEGLEAGRAEGRAEGLEKGLKKGRAEGETQKARSIAKAMLQRGMDIQTIAELSGLTAEEVQSFGKTESDR